MHDDFKLKKTALVSMVYRKSFQRGNPLGTRRYCDVDSTSQQRRMPSGKGYIAQREER